MHKNTYRISTNKTNEYNVNERAYEPNLYTYIIKTEIFFFGTKHE